MPPRDPYRQDREHLAFVRKQPCCVCGTRFNVEAAHVRMASAKYGKASGMQQKPHDMWTVPLCDYHHRLGPVGVCQHKGSEAVFWATAGIDPFELAIALWIKSGAAARAAAREGAPPRPQKKTRQGSR